MRIECIGAALGMAMLTSTASHAAVITRTYDFVASGFVQLNDPNAPLAPYDPVDVNFTLTFDDSISSGPTTSGLTINSNTVPYSSQFEYDAASDILTVATSPIAGNGYTFFPNEYGFFIYSATKSAPIAGGSNYAFDNGTQFGFEYGSTTSVVTASALVSAVPLPASAPMFGAALLALGAAGYGAKRNKAAAKT